jgi:hypothetical protein
MFRPLPPYLSFLGRLSEEPFGTFATLIRELPVSDTCGFKKLDIIYVYNEQISSSILDRFSTYFEKKYGYTVDVEIEDSIEIDFKNTWIEFMDSIQSPFGKEFNLIYDISNDKGVTLRAFDHELNFSEQYKNEDVINEAYNIVHFSLGNISDWKNKLPSGIEEPVKEIIWALQLDGLTEYEAIQHILSNNILEKDKKISLENNFNKMKEDIMHVNIPSFYYSIKKQYSVLF